MNKLMIALCLLSLSSYARASSSEIAALKRQLIDLSAALEKVQQKIDKLESNKLESAKETGGAARTKIKGDLRYRYEQEDDELRADVRNRQRVRARVSVTSEINDTVDVEIGIASGDTGSGSATSTNQSFDDAFSTKEIGLDLAYFDWHPNEHISIIGGKMKNPFYKPAKSALIWDGDIRPEGLALQWSGGPIFANLGAFYLEEDRNDRLESFLFGAQLGTEFKTSGINLTAGLGYYQFDGLKNNAKFGQGFKDNTVFNDGFENDFELIEFFAKLDFKISRMKASIFADYVTNTATDDQANNGDNDVGYLAGFELKPGNFSFKYYYEDLENDAVVGGFSDSDFAGGGTDGKGHIVSIGYKIDNQWKLGLKYYKAEEDGQVSGTQFNDIDLLQADIKFKF